MQTDCFVVHDGLGKQRAGPFSERAARLWIALNSHRYRALPGIRCIDVVWEPVASYRMSRAVPAAVWALQRTGELIVVISPDGTAVVFP